MEQVYWATRNVCTKILISVPVFEEFSVVSWSAITCENCESEFISFSHSGTFVRHTERQAISILILNGPRKVILTYSSDSNRRQIKDNQITLAVGVAVKTEY